MESALFYKLPAIRFHILTPFLVGKLNRYDEVGLFSGMLFCADCGHVMYQQRYQNKNRKQDCYIATRSAPVTVRRTLSAPTC